MSSASPPPSAIASPTSERDDEKGLVREASLLNDDVVVKMEEMQEDMRQEEVQDAGNHVGINDEERETSNVHPGDAGIEEDVEWRVKRSDESLQFVEEGAYSVCSDKRFVKQLRELQSQLQDAINARERARTQTSNLQRRLRALTDTIHQVFPLAAKSVTDNNPSHRLRLQALLFEETEDVNIYHRRDKDFEPVDRPVDGPPRDTVDHIARL
ncbi:hypothetical protein BKA70DRAFT_1447926 [Coprinopsis sp. MPI-PUGE-AT-0042]|nr:hypothetical protein BKA70DRAFT_1447926 [Coprinopsis sp. MPI-PUGE-AT-0042]